MALGLPESSLKDKHGSCPLCGGKDRFRWDNKEGRGTYICGQCGAGNGMELAINYTGREFKEVAADIDGLLGNIKFNHDKIKPELTDQQRKNALRDVWAATKPIEQDDLAHKYLSSRKIDELIYPPALRFAEALRDGDGGIRPCMVAMVGVYGQEKFCTMHRTFLSSSGGKAEMPSPRKLMPGSLPDGACVMLSDYHGGPLGIAEGIETAMSASALYSLPVWAAINSTMLEKWFPPESCDEIVIFGDNDAKFGGQKSAYTLAHKLAVKGFNVSVKIPDQAGFDWADIYCAKT